jgi:hypothetical protein
VSLDPDGALTIRAAGTALNPNHGFQFRVGGPKNAYVVNGQLDAFGACRGAFHGRMVTVLEPSGARSYEVRFREHCMIVVH